MKIFYWLEPVFLFYLPGVFKHPSDVNLHIVLHRFALWVKEALGTNMQRKRAVNIANYPQTSSAVTSCTNKIDLKDPGLPGDSPKGRTTNILGKENCPQIEKS